MTEKEFKDLEKEFCDCETSVSLKELGFTTIYTPKVEPMFDYDDDIIALQKLKNCRNAYWKLYGDEIGLGKPWEPDWTNYNDYKFVIGVFENEIIKCYNTLAQYVLAFPTEEMRDAFYENFKSEIESCKELL